MYRTLTWIYVDKKLKWQKLGCVKILPDQTVSIYFHATCLTHLSADWPPFLLGVFWLDSLFGCPPLLPSDWPSLMSLACLKSPCPAPRPTLPPPRPLCFGCLREVWGLAVKRERHREQMREIKLKHEHIISTIMSTHFQKQTTWLS